MTTPSAVTGLAMEEIVSREEAIVWEEDVSALLFVRESVVLMLGAQKVTRRPTDRKRRSSRRPLPETTMWQRRVGYSVLRSDVEPDGPGESYSRRVFWLEKGDEALTAPPAGTVNPSDVRAGSIAVKF
jgi:Family of unknown function (DUF6009)